MHPEPTASLGVFSLCFGGDEMLYLVLVVQLAFAAVRDGGWWWRGGCKPSRS